MMLLMLATGVSAQTSNTSRLSAWLQESVRHNSRQAFTDSTTPSGRRADAADMLTTVFVQMQDGINDEMLAQYGCKKYAQLGDIAIVTVPLENVGALSEQPEVLRVEANDKARPTLDLVPTVTNLLPVYEQTAQHPAFT